MSPRTLGPRANNNNSSSSSSSNSGRGSSGGGSTGSTGNSSSSRPQQPQPSSGNITAPAPAKMHRPSSPPPLTALQTHTPPSNSDPDLDLDPSPVYSPLSTPAQTPRPPPSPPMAPVDAPRAYTTPITQHVKISTPETSNTPKTTPAATATTPATSPSTTSYPTTTTPPSTNTDSIALRSTLRLLMLQRERARKDIQTLEELRLQAMGQPVEFIDYIQELARGSPSNDYGTTSGSSDEEGTSTNTKKKKKKHYAAFAGHKDLPKPQEIFRCPPIEWEKYRVLGAPLDKLVEEQQRRPQVVPQQMQTGGVLGVGVEFGDKISGDGNGIQGRMRLFDRVAQRGGVVGR